MTPAAAPTARRRAVPVVDHLALLDHLASATGLDPLLIDDYLHELIDQGELVQVPDLVLPSGAGLIPAHDDFLPGFGPPTATTPREGWPPCP